MNSISFTAGGFKPALRDGQKATLQQASALVENAAKALQSSNGAVAIAKEQRTSTLTAGLKAVVEPLVAAYNQGRQVVQEAKAARQEAKAQLKGAAKVAKVIQNEIKGQQRAQTLDNLKIAGKQAVYEAQIGQPSTKFEGLELLQKRQNLVAKQAAELAEVDAKIAPYKA
ncbi:MAG: hypothetical protein WCG23_06540 [bacterium]